MKFTHVYECLRCGVVFVGKSVQESRADCQFTTGKHEHICAPSEYGIGLVIGYNVIDEEEETPPVGES